MNILIKKNSRKRIALLTLGISRAESASLARIAQTIKEMRLSADSAECIERRIRRMENDTQLNAARCFHPFPTERLDYGRPNPLLLILDPTTQDDGG